MAVYNVHGGHNSIVPGAGKYLNEVAEDRKVKDAVITMLRGAGHTVYDCTDDVGRTQGQNLANIVAKCNAHNVDLDISIHLNAGGGTGVEVYYYSGDSVGAAKAAAVSAAISEALGIRNRGAKPTTGLYVLSNTSATAILVECCFVDNTTDKNAWNVDKCATAIAEAVTGKSVSSSTGSTVTKKKSADVQLWTPNNTFAQRWIPHKNADGTYCLECASCGLYLDVMSGGLSNPNPVWVYEKNGSDSQKWIVQQVDKDGYDPDFARPIELIPVVNKNLRLDCVDGRNEDGTGIQVFTANGTTAQQWGLVDTGAGSWVLINVDSSKALDVKNGG